MLIKKYSLSDMNTFVYSNIVSNPAITLGTDNYTGFKGALTSSLGILSLTNDGTAAYGEVYQNTSYAISPSKKFFVMVGAKVTNALCASIRLECNGSDQAVGATTNVKTQFSPTNGTLYNLSGIYTVPASGATGNLRVAVWQFYADAATSNSKVLNIQEVFAIDLTEKYGAGNEPNATDCANIFRFTETTKQPSLSKTLSA